MTRTPQLSQQKKRSLDQQYRPPAQHPTHPPHQNQQQLHTTITAHAHRSQQAQEERYRPPPLPQSQQFQEQQQRQALQKQRNMPPLHAYSTNDLFDARGQNGVAPEHGGPMITANDELYGMSDNDRRKHKESRGKTQDDINLNPLNLPVYERSESSFRWIVLILACWSMFGSYYCFDNPAALSNQFQDADGEYHLSSLQFNLLYSVYSIPNVILPLFGGVLVDKIGAEISMVLFLGLITGGQAVFAFATSINNFYLMCVGRVIFGLGGESLCVAVSTLLAVYFKGKEMAFALGLNLSLARAGSSLNDWATLFIYHQWDNLAFCIWCGFFLLCVCLFFTILMVVLDRWQAKKMTNKGFFVPQAHTGEIVRFKDILSFDACYWLLTISCVVVYGCVLPWNNIGSNFMVSKYGYNNSRANSYLLIPYLMSAILTPPVGYFVDRVGRRAELLLVSAASLAVTHFLFAWSSATPLYGLVILGLAYSIYASAIWPSIALVVNENVVGTAYGIITAVQNSGLAAIPIVVGLLVEEEEKTINGTTEKIKNYKHVEMFLFGLALLGVSVGIGLRMIEPKYGNRLKIPSIQKRQEEEGEGEDEVEKQRQTCAYHKVDAYEKLENKIDIGNDNDNNNNDVDNNNNNNDNVNENDTANGNNTNIKTNVNESIAMNNEQNDVNAPMLANDQFTQNSLDHTPQHLPEEYEKGHLDHTPINMG